MGCKAGPGSPTDARTCTLPTPGAHLRTAQQKPLPQAPCHGAVRTIQRAADVSRFLKTEVTAHAR